MIGQIIGNYKIVALLGEGNMGAVYQAVNIMDIVWLWRRFPD